MRQDAVHTPQPLQRTALTSAQASLMFTAIALYGQLISQRPQAEHLSLLT
jgi:hypothetical protein